MPTDPQPVPVQPPVRSWRTTAAGIAGAVATLIGLVLVPILDEDPATQANWAEAIPIALVALGLGAARDHQVSSAQAGVR